MAGALPGGPTARVRVAQRDQLLAAAERAASGSAVTVAVTGEAGAGKSWLLDQVLEAWRSRGLPTMCGRVDELELARPFATILDAAGTASPEVEARVRRAVEPTHREGADRSLAVADALLEALDELAVASGAVLLAIDDADRADTASRTVLRRIARRSTGLPIALVVTARATDDVGELLDAATSAGASTDHVHLPGLDADEVAALARAVLGSDPAPRLLRRLDACGGNPLFVGELLRGLERDGALRRGDGLVEVDPAAHVPSTVRHVIARRIEALPADTTALLEVAAVVGRSFGPDELARLAERPVADVVGSLRAAHRADVIAPEGARWRFRHDLVRETLRERLAPPDLRALHHQAARTLRAVGPPERVAHHWLAAGAPLPDEAVDDVRAAVDQVQTRSVHVAVELLERLLAALPLPDRRRDEVLAELLHSYTACGRADEVEPLAATVLAHDPPADVAERVRAAIAHARYSAGDIAGFEATLLGMLDDPGLPPRARAETEARLAIAALLRLDLADMARRVDAARRVVPGSEDGFAAGLVDYVESLHLLATGRPAAARPLARAAAGRQRRGEVAMWEGYSGILAVALAEMECDELDLGAALLSSSLPALESVGASAWIVQFDAVRALVEYLRGDLDAAQATAAQAVASSAEFGPRFVRGVPLSVLGLVAAHRGDLTAARRHADEAGARYAELGPELGIELSWLLDVTLLETAGDRDEAFERARLAWELSAPLRSFASWRLLAPRVARLAVGRDQDLLHEVAAVSADAAERNTVASATAAAQLCRGYADRDPDALVAAVAAYEASPRRLEAAIAAADVAELLHRTRHPGAAVAVDAALARLRACGADGDVGRLELATGRRPSPRRPSSGWDSLTPAERRVVELVPDGLTNRQVGDLLGVSRRTVETHLSHAFAKLGVTTRVQLAAAAAARRSATAAEQGDASR